MNTNYPIQSKIENSGGETEETIWCDVCLEDDQKIEATVYCKDCEKNQCENCDLIHKIRRFSKHVRTDPQPSLFFNLFLYLISIFLFLISIVFNVNQYFWD
ncbi:hypothetical protein M0813_01209 [Anaeramoeba flamelloides]|uniref:B box-type domain-containing protein n=1 Tax=Anaeramoeba flamelloides TaxID=1746091 RepID=A0ABQ8ZBW5_9EUKA|nr:hypothetical protein M0813_01209 [Anaeramoeba flamelloides]